MKRILSTAGWLVVAAALTIGMTACSGSEDIADSQQIPAGEAAPKTYTMTIVASKGGGAQARATRSGGTVMCATWADGSDEAMTEQACGATRALGLSDNGNTLNASWTVGDVVKVLKVGTTSYPTVYFDLGTLAAVNVSDETCTLMGTLDSDKISQYGLIAGDNLVLVSPGNKAGSGGNITLTYTGQNGTLAKIASDYDYCMTSMNGSMVSVAIVDNGKITTTGTATFAPQQAIVRFTLVDEDDHPIVPDELTISSLSLQPTAYLTSSDAPVSGNSLTLTNGNHSNVFYAALRGVSGNGKVTLTATSSDGSVYAYKTSNNVTFTNGKFYDIKVKMKMGTVNLANLTEDYQANDGDILYGTLPDGRKLSIRSGAKVTLNGVTINGVNNTDCKWAGITCEGNAEITLVGTNTVKGFYNKYPGIYVPENKTLTIKGSGSLNASSNGYAAGIGGGYNISCGNITISGGTVTSTGGNGAAGIGSGNTSSCGDITISGGTVTATGGEAGAGIGSGHMGSCGAITIGSDITRVTAIKGSLASDPIGRGEGCTTVPTVTVDGIIGWTASTEIEHLNFEESTTNYTNDTWILTHK